MSMATKLGRVGTYLEGLLPIKSYDSELHGFSKSCDKLRTLYCDYRNVYEHQTWQGDDIQSGDVGSFNVVVLWVHVTN